MMGYTCRLVYKFLLFPLFCLLLGWGTGAVILGVCLFLCLTEGRFVICSRFSGLGGGGSEAGYLCCLLKKRLGIMRERLWGWDL